MGRQGTYLKLVTRDPDLVPVERPGRRSTEHASIDRKRGSVARTHEVLAAVVPMVGASEMGALGREGDRLIVRGLQDPRRSFLAADLPAIHLVDPERDLLRSALGKLCHVRRINPLIALFGAG